MCPMGPYFGTNLYSRQWQETNLILILGHPLAQLVERLSPMYRGLSLAAAAPGLRPGMGPFAACTGFGDVTNTTVECVVLSQTNTWLVLRQTATFTSRTCIAILMDIIWLINGTTQTGFKDKRSLTVYYNTNLFLNMVPWWWLRLYCLTINDFKCLSVLFSSNTMLFNTS